ncbi:MAG: YbaK/EbsC family protein [Caldilineaceae bacterium]
MDHLTSPPVSVTLTKLGVPHTIFRHTGPVNSLEQAAAERGQQPEQIVRSILFRLGRAKDDGALGNFALVLMAGPGQIAWKSLRQHFGQSRLTMATPEEVLAVTGYPIGAVAPFGMASAVPVLVDESVTRQIELSMGSGVRGVAVVLSSAALLSALGDVTIGCFGETTYGTLSR